jgi:hypothetical protein
MKKKRFTTIRAKRVSHPVRLPALVLNLVLFSGQGPPYAPLYVNASFLCLPSGSIFTQQPTLNYQTFINHV